MTFTPDQIQALRQGDPVRVSAPEIGAACVVLRADVYERFQAVLEDGLPMDEVGSLVDRNMQEDDQGDPLLDSYQQYRK